MVGPERSAGGVATVTLPEPTITRMVRQLRTHWSLDPDDLRQLLCEGAWLATLSYDASHGVPLHAWCVVSAYHHARARLHEAGGMRRGQLRVMRRRPQLMPSWDAMPPDVDRCIDLMRAVEGLPVRQREVLTRMVQGEHVDELQNELQCSRRRVYQLAERGRAQLAQML